MAEYIYRRFREDGTPDYPITYPYALTPEEMEQDEVMTEDDFQIKLAAIATQAEAAKTRKASAESKPSSEK
jgi:hypothetical protein